MIFADASAMVSVIAKEPGHEPLLGVFMGEANFVTSSLAVWEAVVALHKKGLEQNRIITIDAARAMFRALKDGTGMTIVPIQPADGDAALAAFEKYGRGQESKAKLNMGDCFHYAVAKRLGAAILFTSPDEFHHTDLDCVPAGA